MDGCMDRVSDPDRLPRILRKPGPLTPEDREVVQRHAVTGVEICGPLRSLRAVSPIIRHHHERRDGSGYPDGLQGEAIPLTARILQVVDIFDAVTTDRPFRRALSCAQALDILDVERRRGWWDPGMVEALRCVVNGAAHRQAQEKT